MAYAQWPSFLLKGCQLGRDFQLNRSSSSRGFNARPKKSATLTLGCKQANYQSQQELRLPSALSP